MTRAAIIREHRLDERMVGDPRVAAGDLMALKACLYAAAILRKRGALPADASGFEARWAPEARAVTFWRCGKLAAVFRIPDRVMDYDPYAPARNLPERHEEKP
jgi:hypothetical protein